MAGHIRIFHTPEAKAKGHYYEHFGIIAEMEEGILAHQGGDLTVFLPWEYLSKFRYQYV